jgi:hypothetical protein
VRFFAAARGRLPRVFEGITGVTTIDDRRHTAPTAAAARMTDGRQTSVRARRDSPAFPAVGEGYFATGTFRRNSSKKFWSITISCSGLRDSAVSTGLITATRLPSGARSHSVP